MQIPAPLALSPFIRHYLFLESNEKSLKKLRLFSDGSTGMVFTFKNRLFTGFDGFKGYDYLPETFLYGQITHFKDIFSAGETSLVIVVFQPAGINQLLGISGETLQNQVVGLYDIFGSESTELATKLAEESNIYQKTAILNIFFSALASHSDWQKHWLINSSLHYIRQNKGLVSVAQLATFTGYTERHLERKFLESIGLSPKKFGNLVRLHHFLTFLKNTPHSHHFTSLVYEAGYTDQSHFIRDFKKITGITPTGYTTNPHKLAVNFLAL